MTNEPNQGPATETTGGNAVWCGCCGDLHHVSLARIDKDLQTAVCPDCFVKLRWAQAWLKRNGIAGCRR